MFSMLVFMCRDPGDATSKVSCCVQTSYCFKNRDFDASVKVPVALPLKMSLTQKENTANLKSASFIVIMLLHKGLTSYSITNKALAAFWREFRFNTRVNRQAKIQMLAC